MTDHNTDSPDNSSEQASSGVLEKLAYAKEVIITKAEDIQAKYKETFGDGLLGLVLPLFAIAVLVVATVVGIFAYQLGVQKGKSISAVVAVDENGKEITAADVKAMSLDNSILKSEIETLIKERDISLNNLNLVRDEIGNLKSDNSELKTLTDNLSETLNQQNEIKGATADIVEMKIREASVADDGAVIYDYHFNILVPSMTERQIVPKLVLLNSTSMVEVPLKPSSYKAKGIVNIDGKFAMPEGFVPSQLQFIMTVDGEKISKLYNWQVD